MCWRPETVFDAPTHSTWTSPCEESPFLSSQCSFLVLTSTGQNEERMQRTGQKPLARVEGKANGTMSLKPKPASTSASKGTGGMKINTTVVASSTESNPLNLMYLDQDVLEENFMRSTRLMQKHTEDGHARRQRHEQRRRKFLRQLDAKQTDFSANVFEETVVAQMLNFARCEEDEEEIRNEVLCYKTMMVLNRKNRDEKIASLLEKDEVHDAVWRSEQASREMQWVVQSDKSSQLHRRSVLMGATRAADRDEAISMVNDFITKLLDQVDWTLTCRELGGFGFQTQASKLPSEVVPESAVAEPESTQTSSTAATEAAKDVLPFLLWKDASRMLTAALPFLKPLPNLQPELPTRMLQPFSVSESPLIADQSWLTKTLFSGANILNRDEEVPTTSADFLAQQDWSDFLKQLNEESARQFIAQHADQQAANEAPSSNENWERDTLCPPRWLISTPAPYLLGEAVVDVRCTVHPIQEDPPLAFDFRQAFPLRLALFGVSNRLREMAIEVISQAVSQLHVISVEALVKDIYAVVPTQQEHESTTSHDDEYRQLATEVFESLRCGDGITDKLYVKLILHELQKISTKRSNGFLLSDFPNSKEQLLLLMEGFSNIRFDEHRPQRSDNASNLSTLAPDTPELVFDISKCGLDAVICVDTNSATNCEVKEGSAIDGPLFERVHARTELFSQQTVYITEETTSVDSLQKIYDPQRAMATCGLDLTISEQNVSHIRSLTQKLGILTTVDYQMSDNPKEALAVMAEALVSRHVPVDQRSEQYWIDLQAEIEAQALREAELQREAELAEALRMQVDEEQRLQSSVSISETDSADPTAESAGEDTTKIVEVVSSSATAAQPTTSSATEGAEGDAEPVVVDPYAELKSSAFDRLPPVVQDTKLHVRHAEALNNLWELNEKSAQVNAMSFFTTMRDIRYQLVQRRRIAFDLIFTAMSRLDDRQASFNKFREAFNEIESDLRFDPECIAELFLRTSELRNEYAIQCENRWKDVKLVIQDITLDGNIEVLLFNSRYESAFFLQSELNRFYHHLQILFDVCKALQGFAVAEKIGNQLEVLLPASTFDDEVLEVGKGGKGKDKEKKATGKDKNGPSWQPFREPVAPYFTTNSAAMIAQIPTSKKPAEEVDPKAKGKGKEKKGEESAPTDFFAIIEAQVMEEVGKWKEGVFSLSRELFLLRDEQLCSRIEAAVWYEAEKLAMSVQMIKSQLVQQNDWMRSSETALVQQLEALAKDRYLRELASCEDLAAVIERCIIQAQPLQELWLVSPDATALVDPTTAWQRMKFILSDEMLSSFEMRSHQYQQGNSSMPPRHGKSRPQSGSRDSLFLEGPDGVYEGSSASLADRPRSSSATRSGRRGTEDLQANSQQSKRRPSTATGTSMARKQSIVGRNPQRGRRDDVSQLRTALINSTPHLRQSSSKTPSGSSSRPRSSSEAGQLSKEKQLYLQQRKELEIKFQKLRAKKEEHYRSMGMSSSAALLAAHHELLFEEEHQFKDLEAKFRVASARARKG